MRPIRMKADENSVGAWLTAVLALLGLGTTLLGATEVWTGAVTNFTMAAGANSSDPASQDRLTANVWITRNQSQGLYNAKTEASYQHFFSPADTAWAYGELSNYATLTYTNWEGMFGGTAGGGPRSTIGKAVVLHLVSDDIYLSATFTQWGGSLGGFSWSHSSPAPQITGPNPAVVTAITVTNKYPSPPLTTNQVPVIANGLLTLSWQGDTNGAFDLLYATELGANTLWNVAQANIPADPSGLNVFSDPPYFACPANRANRQLYYRVRSLPAPPAPLGVRLEVAASNLVSPTVLTHAQDGSGRLFIADQTGQIWIVDSTGALLSAPFLDISNRLVSLQPGYDERGLLGLAFHPGYSTNGRFFVYYSAPSPDTNYDNKTVLSEFQVSATNTNLADAASERVLLTILEPEANDQGAAVVFGPDGYLYIGLGDGGGAGDQHGTYGNGQMLDTLLGKIVRIDVDHGNPYAIPPDNPFVSVAGARPEIYAYGLRNPWRFSFDRDGSHQGFIADVGQNLWEELDILRKGANYGWRIMEGNHLFDPTVATALGIDIATLDFPILEYGHGPVGISIIGGFVYRGTLYPKLAGSYVFGDFSTSFGIPDGQLYYLTESRPGIWERFSFQLNPPGARLARFIKGFGEDENGELYLLSTTQPGPSGRTGDVRKILPP